jgi:hypothetical protein
MEGIVAMSVKQRRVYQLAMEVVHHRLSIAEFSSLIGKSYRQARRIVRQVRLKDALGVQHGNLGRTPCNKTPEDLETEVLALLKTKYYDFNLTHFQERIAQEEGIILGKNIIHRIAKKHSLVKRPKRRSRVVHKPRPRFPSEGMLVQFDGSEHIWFGNFHSDLIVGIDDATSKILGAEFFIGETSLHCLKVMRDITLTFGTPEAYYLDQAGYFGKRDLANWDTQIGRALETLGSRAILAGSPQAKGRVERLFNTLQDRLIAELRLQGIQSIPRANEFLQNQFIPYFNKRFSVLPREKGSRFVQHSSSLNLESIFCIKEDRKITTSNKFSWAGSSYFVQSERDYRYRTIHINTHIDGSISFDVMGLPVQVNKYVPQRKNEYYPKAVNS